MNSITKLFNIKYPIVQGGMIWCSGWELASAVSNSGGLGLIGAGSMHPDTLQEHIIKTKKATKNPFGVNVPLIYPDIEQVMDIIVKEKVPVVFTSAGSPAVWTKKLQAENIKVVHVVANTKFALKCEAAGVDAIVAEGFEAGGHNGREETTTLCLIPHVRKVVNLPLIAAGGIGSGRAMAAAMMLGANGVQVGSLFAASTESSGHEVFKKLIVDAKEGDTKLALKKTVPTRLLNNEFYKKVLQYENEGATVEKITELLGKGRAKKGMFLGDLNEGELEIGQVSAMINEIKPVKQIVEQMVMEFNQSINILDKI